MKPMRPQWQMPRVRVHFHTAVLIGTDGSGNWVPGKFGNALSLDGSNDYGYTSGYKGVTGTTRRTLSLWFKTSTANKPILQYGAAGTGTLFKVSINGSGVAVVDLGNVTVTGGSSLANGPGIIWLSAFLKTEIPVG